MTNRILGVILLVVGAVVGLALVVAIATTPQPTLAFFDRAHIKFLLALFASLFIALIGCIIFWMWYVPSPRRFLYTCGCATLAFTGMMAIGQIGLSRLQEVEARSGGVEVTYSMKFAAPSSAWVIVAGLVVLFFFYREYRKLAVFEFKNGPVP